MAFEGEVRTMPVRDLLEWLARRGATGTLSLSHGMVVRRFHLEAGRVTLASSSEQGQLLGQMLVDMGRIDAGALEGVLRERNRYGERLGITLTLAGLLSEAEVAEVLRGKVRMLLTDALTWREGRFVYEDGEPTLGRPLVPMMFDVRELLAAADAVFEDETLVTDTEVIETIDANAA